MGDEQDEDKPFITCIGPLVIDWPRTIGFYGGITAAIALDLVAPPLGIAIACVPLLKILKRKHATLVERAIAAVLEGAAKPVGGDADSTIRPRWQEEERKEKEQKLRKAEELAAE